MAHLITRLLWFLFVGWWLAPIWFTLSVTLMFTIVFFPIGAWAATKTWEVMVLSRSPKKIVVEAQNV